MVPATVRPALLVLTARVALARMIVLGMVTVSGRTACVRWVGLGTTVRSRAAPATAQRTVAVWTALATVPQDSWVRRVSKRCAPMAARGTVVAMV